MLVTFDKKKKKALANFTNAFRHTTQECEVLKCVDQMKWPSARWGGLLPYSFRVWSWVQVSVFGFPLVTPFSSHPPKHSSRLVRLFEIALRCEGPCKCVFCAVMDRYPIHDEHLNEVGGGIQGCISRIFKSFFIFNTLLHYIALQREW